MTTGAGVGALIMAQELDRLWLRSASGYDSDDSLLLDDEDDGDYDRRRNSTARTYRVVRLYTWFLAKFPYIIPILIIGGTVGCGVYSWKKHPPPDFDDPTKGFETRGTHIQKRAWTLENLYQHEDDDLFLKPNASLFAEDMGIPPGLLNVTMPSRGKRSAFYEMPLRWQGKSHWMWSPQRIMTLPVERAKRAAATNGMVGSCFPNAIFSQEPMFLFEGQNLLSVESLHAMCDIETTHIRPNLSPSCQLKSIAHFVGLLTGKSCGDITEEDVIHSRALLADCASYYYNGSLIPYDKRSQNAPMNCTVDNLVYKIFNYLVPRDFMKSEGNEEKKNAVLSASAAYADPSTDPQDWRQFYEKFFANRAIHKKGVKLSGLHLPNQQGIKYEIFDEFLLHDAWYFLLAASLIVVIMMMYLRSVVLTLATIINVAISFTLAYTIYHAIPGVDFFPFMNLLTALVLIAVGADDVFIFHDAWQQAKMADKDGQLCDVMAVTFSHAALSIFVTSLTTAAAFFVNFISQITAIKCFGLFSGIAILCNFALMITWTPCIILCTEYVWRLFKRLCCPNVHCKCLNVFTKASGVLYEQFFPKLIEKGWFLWIFVLVGLGAGGSVVVFVKPKLNLPTTQDFQLFPSGNLLEHWDLHFQDRFQAVVDSNKNTRSLEIPIFFIWGFKPTDSGNYMDPDNKGTAMEYDNTFDFYSNESQVWLETFCGKLKVSSFAPSYYVNGVCSGQAYGSVLTKFCSQYPFLPGKLAKCCEKRFGPYDPETLEMCAPGMQMLLGQDPRGLMGYPIFDLNNKAVGYLMVMRSTLERSMSYDAMEEHYKVVQDFVDEQLSSAPPGMKGVFFNGRYDFMFYDLQKAISFSTYYSIILSLCVALVMMFLTSLNFLITLYAIFTIGLVIICTVATIVLMGWDLNILESVAISLAVGLSIDFAIHYGVAYRLSRAKTSLGRVNESFSRVGSAVAMAALTTFCAGAAMMRSNILAYTKLGIFLMLVMTFSWIYSTFLFQSICRIIGPRGDFCQISWDCFLRRKKRVDEDSDSLSSSASFDSLLITF